MNFLLRQPVDFIVSFTILVHSDRYTEKFEIGRHYIEERSQSVASEIMQFSSFRMQIGHYKTYATMFKNELSRNCQDLRKKILQERVFVPSCPGIYGLMTD